MLSFEQIKWQRNHDFIQNLKNPLNFTLIFSIIDLSSKDFKNLSKNLKDQKSSFSNLVNTSYLKKNINNFKNLKKLQNIIHGLIYVSLYKIKDLDLLNIKVEDSSNYYLVGILYNNTLYYPSYLKKFNNLTFLGIFSKLINFFYFKQSIIYFYVSSLKKFFFYDKR
jgi:hypothetical protein